MRIAVAAHVTEVAGPVQALYNYLRRTKQDFSFAFHPFGYTGKENSQFEQWQGDALVSRKQLSSPRTFSILRDVVANLLWFSSGPRSDMFIGIDNVNAFCGLILRAFGRTSRVIYYVIDYTPRRFSNPFFNAVYHAVDRICARSCDEIWNISDRIADVRRQQGVEPERNRVVGVGVDFSNIVQSPTKRRHDLVLVSHLTESKGVQLAISAMDEIIEKVPDARLLIIGTGPYESALRALAAKSRHSESIQFLGLMNHQQLFSYLPSCGIALAPYVDDPSSITYYADPTKPKEYLACGLPIIITDVPWIAREIATKPMGVTINYNTHEFVDAVLKLTTDAAFYDRCASNALTFVRHMTWTAIYEQAFEKAGA